MADARADGAAFLLFGNDVDPAARDAYERWHAGHHVPQRLTVPGIVGAIRFRAQGEGWPQYLTFYRLAGIEVLSGAPYRRLVDHPDAETLAMRPVFRRPVRLAARCGAIPPIPAGASLRVERVPPLVAPAGGVVVPGELDGHVPGHPLSAADPPPVGPIALVFDVYSDEVSAQAVQVGSPLPGRFLPLDRYGVDALR